MEKIKLIDQAGEFIEGKRELSSLIETVKNAEWCTREDAEKIVSNYVALAIKKRAEEKTVPEIMSKRLA